MNRSLHNQPDYSVVKDHGPERQLEPYIWCERFTREPSTGGCSSHLGSRGGVGKRVRTADPLLAKQVLSQLSYTPVAMTDLGGGPR